MKKLLFVGLILLGLTSCDPQIIEVDTKKPFIVNSVTSIGDGLSIYKSEFKRGTVAADNFPTKRMRVIAPSGKWHVGDTVWLTTK